MINKSASGHPFTKTLSLKMSKLPGYFPFFWFLAGLFSPAPTDFCSIRTVPASGVLRMKAALRAHGCPGAGGTQVRIHKLKSAPSGELARARPRPSVVLHSQATKT